MNAYIVAEGILDRQLLEKVLPVDLAQDVAVVAAGGGSGATSMARTLLVRQHVPVALVLDGDSLSPERLRERSMTLRELLRSVSAGAPSEVFLAVPALEGIFFQNSRLLERLLRLKVPETVAIRAEARPKEELNRLLENHPAIKSIPQLVDALTPQDVEELRQAQPIADLLQFLRQALQLIRAGAA